jgi:hypothetical protein
MNAGNSYGGGGSRFLACCVSAFVLSQSATAQDAPLAALAVLAGHCWKGEFAEGGSWDRHCFEWAQDGHFLRDTHVVTGRRGPYGGETLYRFDAIGKRIVFHYFDATGGYSEGEVQPSAGALQFPDERYEEGGRTRTLRTTWRFESSRQVIAVTDELQGDRWTEAWRIVYRRE